MQFDEGQVYMKESVTSESLTSFLDVHRLPLVVPYRSDYSHAIAGESHLDGYLLVFVDKTSADFYRVVNQMVPVALTFRGQVSSTKFEIHQLVVAYFPSFSSNLCSLLVGTVHSLGSRNYEMLRKHVENETAVKLQFSV